MREHNNQGARTAQGINESQSFRLGLFHPSSLREVGVRPP
jgi:hypothetical protein